MLTLRSDPPKNSIRLLIVGAGGREHALAWKAAQSPRLERLFVAPGNAGTALPRLGLKVSNVPIAAEDAEHLAAFALREKINLAIIGPEAPLAAGLADRLRDTGLRVFGPSRAAAQIEASKAFAKGFMDRHHLPTARYAVFANFEAARQHLRALDYPVVVKASGLAAGKGVLVPDGADEAEGALRQILLDHAFGGAGDQVVIEERLAGPEVSLLAFTDGFTVRPMPPAQDHKRLRDCDLGPNTGGMGAYAPAPLCPPAMVQDLTHTILQSAVDGLRSEGRPFVGVLYAGLMLTPEGPRVLEFNCRLGDPETEVILPLLESDLLDVAEACVEGRLADIDVKWKTGVAAAVVLASEGYPGAYPSGREIFGLDAPPADAVIFHAGTRLADGRPVTAGGRVLCVTGWGPTLDAALQSAYAAAEGVTFDGRQFRRDIGRRALGGRP
jgi:phosphoribosylamine--glycine ligase